jgi:hypothetical protein
LIAHYSLSAADSWVPHLLPVDPGARLGYSKENSILGLSFHRFGLGPM